MGPCHVMHVIIIVLAWDIPPATLSLSLSASLSASREVRVVGHSTMLSTLYSTHSTIHCRLQKLLQDISLTSLSIPSRWPCRNTSSVSDPTSTSELLQAIPKRSFHPGRPFKETSIKTYQLPGYLDNQDPEIPR
jgi:hypothetical protein